VFISDLYFSVPGHTHYGGSWPMGPISELSIKDPHIYLLDGHQKMNCSQWSSVLSSGSTLSKTNGVYY
jgi:hypothetical protein